GVVRRAVVEQQGERWVACGLRALRERLDHGGAVLFIAYADADRGITGGIDDELEVHGKNLAVEHDAELLAVTNPLRAWEEGFEAAAQGLLVARSTAAARGSACTVLEQEVRDERVAKLDPMIASHVL